MMKKSICELENPIKGSFFDHFTTTISPAESFRSVNQRNLDPLRNYHL